MNSSARKFGLIGGLFSVALSYLIYFSDYKLFATFKYGVITFLIVTSITILAIRNRKKLLNGLISFKEAFLTGFGACLLAAVIGLISGILLFEVIDPGLKERLAIAIVDNTIAIMEKFGTPNDVIDDTITQMQEDNLPQQFTWSGQLLGFVKGLFFYALLSVIIAAIMKTNKDKLILADS